jgi:hypothetical protein
MSRYMISYLAKLNGLMPRATETSEAAFRSRVIPFLVDQWLTGYGHDTRDMDVIETTVSRFSYLFDITAERLIAAWGISAGRDAHERDGARMARFPLSGGPHYHRGHAIPHRLGGPTDINLVPQRGSINVGAFRNLENRAVKTPGALYFTHWLYDRDNGQRPAGVHQGLLVPGRAAEVTHHDN